MAKGESLLYCDGAVDAGERPVSPYLPAGDDAACDVPFPEPLPAEVLHHVPAAPCPDHEHVGLQEPVLHDGLFDLRERRAVGKVRDHTSGRSEKVPSL
jgi:hypothetical protein